MAPSEQASNNSRGGGIEAGGWCSVRQQHSLQRPLRCCCEWLCNAYVRVAQYAGMLGFQGWAGNECMVAAFTTYVTFHCNACRHAAGLAFSAGSYAARTYSCAAAFVRACDNPMQHCDRAVSCMIPLHREASCVLHTADTA
jgi:hypothetical protein